MAFAAGVTAFLLIWGVFNARRAAYWVRAVTAVAFAWAAAVLLPGDGTLQDPSGDGLLTRYVRQTFNDGPEVALFGIVALVTVYGGIILLSANALSVARKES